MDHPHVDLRLPVEITDMIIDFLFHDTHTLAAMSLVCKAFLPSTRRHIFNTLTLRSDYPPYGKTARARLEEFGPISISLAPVVRRLNIVMAYEFDEIYPDEELNKWITAAMLSFVALRGVTCLSIQATSWVEMKPEVGLFGSFPHLLELSIEGGYFEDEVDLVDSILQCPTIEQLSLRDITIGTDSIVSGQSRDRNLSNLQSFDISGCGFDLEPIINWFLSVDTTSFLHTLRITYIDNRESESIGQFLRALGPSLKHLVLWFQEGV
jgi:hypothetical protein